MKCADGSSHLALLGQLLGDGQHGDVDAPAEQIRDDALRVGQCPLLVSVDEQLLQARVQHDRENNLYYLVKLENVRL
jgi:hypothetical protein